VTRRSLTRKHHTPAWMFERNRKDRQTQKNGRAYVNSAPAVPSPLFGLRGEGVRHKYEAAVHSTHPLPYPSAMSANSASPPPSPRTSSSRLSLYNISNAFIRIRRVRQDRQIVSSSGPEPITHPSLSNVVSTHKVSVSREDQFVCESAVDVPKLLRACRSTLLDQARTIGANVLVEEQCVTSWRLSPSLAYDHSPQMVHYHYLPKKPRGWSVQSPG